MHARLGSAALACAAACLIPPAPARACGGFFCNLQQMDQAGESVVFSYEADGSVTTIVQIRYEGSSNDFAWIVPVPAAPEVSLASAQLFVELERTTRPSPVTSSRIDGECGTFLCPGVDPCGPGRICSGPPPPEAPEPPAPPEITVDILSEIGPYAVAVLEARDGAALQAWLRDNGYRVGADIDAALQPYFDTPHHFVALRLRQSYGRGELQPIAIRSASREPCIPLRLTAIAAVPDMPITVYVLADRRARPASWLLVEPDFGDITFWRGATSYAELVTRAVDDAGGHAFVTDFAGPPPEGMAIEAGLNEADLASVRDLREFLTLLLPLRLEQALLPILRRHLPAPDRAGERDFYRCVRQGTPCGGATPSYLESLAFDPVAVANEIDTAILAPRREGQRMVDEHTLLTRLFTTMSPEEMTQDPIFMLSDELPPERSNVVRATFVTQCNTEYGIGSAPVVLERPGGGSTLVAAGTVPICAPEVVSRGPMCSTGRDGSSWLFIPFLLALAWRAKRRF